MSSSEQKNPEPVAETSQGLCRIRIGGAVLSGVLGILSFPIFGRPYQLDLLVFLILLPLMLVAQGAGKKRGFVLGAICGLTFVGISFSWVCHTINEFTGMGTLLSLLVYLLWVAYEAVPWAVLGLAMGRCRKSLHLLLVLPLWVGIEHYYPRLWPWHLGGALYDRTWFLQCVDILGTSGLTALVFLTSATAAGLVGWRRSVEGFPRWRVAASAVFLLVCCVYGPLRLGSIQARLAEREDERIEVGFIQGFLHPNERRQGPEEEHRDYYLRLRQLLDRYVAETRLLIGEEKPSAVGLVLWPEGSNPISLATGQGVDPWRSPLFNRPGGGKMVLDDFKIPMVIGGFGEGRYNISIYLSRDGVGSIYKKNHPVPFGEWVPGLDLLPDSWRNKLPGIGNLNLGTDNPPMSLGEKTFRNLICYEAVLPEYMRQSSIGSDFLVNLTEDYWYGNTAHIEQHRSVLILRAVESRIPVLRCTNVGPSGIIDLAGEFHGGKKIWEADSFRESFIPGSAPSFYRSWGHWFAFLCLLAGVLELFSGRWRAARRA